LLLDRMVAFSTSPDDDLYILSARAWLGMFESDLAQVREATRRSLDLGAGRITEHAIEVSYHLTRLGDFDAVRALLEPMIERFRREGSFFDLARALLPLGSAESKCGNLALAEAAWSEAVAITIEAGLSYGECHALAGLSVVEARLGKHANCQQHAQRALELSPRVGMGVASAVASFALGLSAFTSGRVEQAIDAFERSGKMLAGTPLSWQPDLIDAYLHAGRVDDARALLLAFEREAAGLGQDFASMIVARCRAALADETDAEKAFDEASRLCDATRWPLERARCDLAHGERLRRSGQRAAARIQLRSALEGFERIGAAGFAERARQELRATGETLRARTADESEQLTAQELQIALLVARGATNREAAASVFLSPKTVEKHLSNAYRKLGVRSRSELARRLAHHS
jgi:DNA-binding CsgD family transcriptional regulator